ncbi:MAG: ribosome biogenesis GTP-binding protein YihA/YsxC [Clostridia bacterium]
MEPYAIKQAEFITSVGQGGGYPSALPCEIAVVGRSNVGKSSLINCITRRNKLARISSTPGKTRMINYFLFNKELYFVDLPGYGFAKTSKTERQSWGQLMGDYLAAGRVNHLFLLLDIRHEPSAEDRQMFEWVLYYGVPFTLVATKSDKLAKSKRAQAANACAKALGAPPFATAFSSETGEGKDALLTRIAQIQADHTVKPEEQEYIAP